MPADFSDRTVLITGGTQGIGLATGLAFGRLGARCVLTHRWGSADDAEIRALFVDNGAATPLIVEADAGRDEDTLRLIRDLKHEFSAVDIFVSNVAFGQITSGPEAYNRRGLLSGIEYSAWPIVSYSQAILSEFGTLPEYVIGLSSHGPDRFIPGYDLVACAKAVLETLAKYLAHHYGPQGTKVNVVRAGMVHTASLESTLGLERIDALKERLRSPLMQPNEIADVVIALCSGYMDSVSGQVITADRGYSFS
ncbi:SDR family oxidoreductase [Methylobacterium sp. WL122]|nr:SDR family oxidoreductase [Methylobacterium sp. WL122]